MFLILCKSKKIIKHSNHLSNIENKKVKPNNIDFVYQPVNNEWRARQCKDVLDDRTIYPLQINTNNADCPYVDLRKRIIKSKISIIPD